MMKKYIIPAIVAIATLSACGKKTEETKPIRKDVTETVFASGILEAKNTYSLTAQTDGYLVVVNFIEGDIVEAGKVLAVVDNKESGFNKESANDLFAIAENNTQNNAPALLQASNSIIQAQRKMEQDYLQYLRYKDLLPSNAIAKVDFENIELQYNTSKTNYDNAKENYNLLKQQADQQLISTKAAKKINETLLTKNEIKAVVKGKVFKKYKQIGDYVKRGDVIALIGEANHIYAKINVDESNISKIKIGQQATVQLNTNVGKTYKGIVSEIYPQFDDASQSFFCKIEFIDTLDFKIVSTQLQSNIVTGIQKNALLIPRNYIDFGGYVQIKGKKEKTKITTAFVGGEWVQVLSGIDENTILETDNIASNNIKTSEAGAAMNK
jgi:HlyD family secretion protein